MDHSFWRISTKCLELKDELFTYFDYSEHFKCLENELLVFKIGPLFCNSVYLVQHLADYMEVFVIEVESDMTQSWKSTYL